MKNIKPISSTYLLFGVFLRSSERQDNFKELFFFFWMGLFLSVLKAYTEERESSYLPLDQLPSKDFVTLPAKEL